MGITVTVNDDSFTQSSTQGHAGETVTFTSNRSSDVTVTLDSSFFNQSSVTLKPGKSKPVSIKNNIPTNATGTFSASKVSSPSVRQDTMQGEIIVGTGP